jgi:UDP-glucose 4-epimerase
VLVTGGAGYIGSHVVHALQETRRFKVISIDNHHNSHAGALARVSELARAELPADASADDRASAEVDAHVADLTNAAAVRAVFAQYGPGGVWGVIHVAAYKAVGESVERPLLYYQNNVGATLTLCQVMSEFGCTRMVYSSSATVYGVPPVIPIPETTRLKADSPYGRSKVMCEMALEDLCNGERIGTSQLGRLLIFVQLSPTHGGPSPSVTSSESHRPLHGTHLITSLSPAGAHPSGKIGEDPRGRPGNLLPLLAHMAVGRVKEDTLKVFGNDYPTPCVFSPVPPSPLI